MQFFHPNMLNLSNCGYAFKRQRRSLRLLQIQAKEIRKKSAINVCGTL